MKNRIWYSTKIIISFLLLITLNFAQESSSQKLTNLRSFAKLYGYVKYFHPSDEASSIDWDRFALLGVEKVKNAEDNFKLEKILKELFIPIAPTMQIYISNEEYAVSSSFIPVDTTGLKIVAWQHFGVRSSSESNVYKSNRINRNYIKDITKTSQTFGNIVRSLPAKNYRGKEIKLSAAVKTKVIGSGNKGQLWLRVDRKNKQPGFFDNMEDRPIISDVWRTYEITGKVDDDAEQIVFGCFLKGSGILMADEFQMFYKDSTNNWITIDIPNSGFEESEGNNSKIPFWFAVSPGYKYQLVTDSNYKGKRSLLIEKEVDFEIQTLFDDYPKPGDIFKKQLTENLICEIPLALYSDSLSTIGKNQNYPFNILSNQLSLINVASLKADNENLRLADVIISWNVFQHFYPYFDVVNIDWDKVLTETLQEALQNKTSDEFYDTLSKMVAKLQDGHGYIFYKRENELGGLSIRVEWIENKCVITASKDSLFQKGDIIQSINGIEAEEYLIEREKYVSGSPQLKRYRALNQFGSGSLGSKVIIQLIRNNNKIELETTRSKEMRGFFFNPISEFNFPDIQEIGENIYYVNLKSTSQEEFNKRINELASAKGIIFDFRSDGKYKRDIKLVDLHKIVSHIIDTTVTSQKWNVPQIIYPDQEFIEFNERHWQIEPNEPSLNSKIVFIIDAHVVSSGETFLGIIENYNLAETVGSVTAGTNGNVNYIHLPGGFKIMWTGMKVLKHDGSQHHLIGIKPTYPVEKTIKAIKEGHDEFLEKALEIINNN